MTDVAALMDCLKRGDGDAVAAAVAANPELAQARDAQGVSVVCLAVYAGQPASAELIAAGRDDLDVFEASVLGQTARVQSLIGADASLIDAFSPDGFHPLGYACFFGHRELFDSLIAAGADVNAPSRNAMTVCPLHSAVATADPELALHMAQVLLEKGADVNATQRGGFTALQEAAQRGHADLIDVLLAAGADKSLRNDEGNNAVGLACMAGYHHLAFKLAPGPVW
jgi:ankyrin repeat protein